MSKSRRRKLLALKTHTDRQLYALLVRVERTWPSNWCAVTRRAWSRYIVRCHPSGGLSASRSWSGCAPTHATLTLTPNRPGIEHAIYIV